MAYQPSLPLPFPAFRSKYCSDVCGDINCDRLRFDTRAGTMFRVSDPAKPRPTHVRYYVLAALCVITFINYVQRNSLGGLETTIRADLSISKEDTGLALGAFFWIYALMQIPT